MTGWELECVQEVPVNRWFLGSLQEAFVYSFIFEKKLAENHLAKPVRVEF